MAKRIVVLENIRSLHNVGAIFRNADAAGWHKVILTGYTGTPPDRRIEKVSLGAEEHVVWEQKDMQEVLLALKNEGFLVYGLEITKNSENILALQTDVLKDKDIVLILGNEVTGIEEETLKMCDKVVHIPMRGEKASLNVSVAAGIAMYALF